MPGDRGSVAPPPRRPASRPGPKEPLSTKKSPPSRGGGPRSPGYRRLPSGSYQVRVQGFPVEVVPDEATAFARVGELRLAKKSGEAIPAPAGTRSRTLRKAADTFLAHKLAHGGRHGALTPAGTAYYTLASRPWREGPLHARPLRSLSAGELQAVIDARTLTNRASSRNEAQLLLAILRHAQASDVVFRPSLLALQVPQKTRRTRRDLTPAEFDHLISFVDARQQRLFQLASTLGSRINELFALERDWCNLEQRQIRIPLEATKEKREKLLDLTDEETDLLREQLLDVYTR